ncbi:hypothetical protein RFI_09674, partial [Reticulomyxa filosa]
FFFFFFFFVNDFFFFVDMFYRQIHTYIHINLFCRTVRQAAIAIESLQTNRYEQFKDMYQRVFQPAVESIADFSSRLKNQLQYFKTTGGRVTNNLQQSRSNYESRWQNYEKSLQDTLTLQSKGETAPTDPFLLGKEFDHVQKEYTHHQKRYNEEMSRLFRELVLADGRRIDSMKLILVDYFLAEKAKAVNCVKMLESSLEYIKAIDRERDVNEFLHRGEFLIADLEKNHKSPVSGHPLPTTTSSTTANAPSTNPTTNLTDKDGNSTESKDATRDVPNTKSIFDVGVHEFSKRTREVSNMVYKDVVRWGTLHRPGRIIAANWKPLFAVITKFGFLHLFQTKQDLKPMVSIILSNVEVEMKKDESSRKNPAYTFEVVVPNTIHIQVIISTEISLLYFLLCFILTFRIDEKHNNFQSNEKQFLREFFKKFSISICCVLKILFFLFGFLKQQIMEKPEFFYCLLVIFFPSPFFVFGTTFSETKMIII